MQDDNPHNHTELIRIDVYDNELHIINEIN